MKWIILLCVIHCQWAMADLKTELKGRLDKIVAKSGLKRSSLGLAVSDSHKNILYEVNGEKHFIPASITKLFTTITVLNALQADYKFHTQLHVDGDLNGSTQKGNIYLKGGGDPAFVSERMWMLVNDFTRSGIKKITGDIVVDDTYFDDEKIDEGREPERNDRAYDAPVSALSFNWNSVNIYIRPGAKDGEKAQVWADPESDYVTLVNSVRTSRGATAVEASRSTNGGKDVITVSGKIAAGSAEKVIYKNISNPALYAGANLKRFLKERGIEVDGNVVQGKLSGSAKLIVDQPSLPLVKLVADVNKFSNNFVAEMLAKGMAAQVTGKQGHMSDGIEQVRKFIEEELKIKRSQFVLANVSGFSRKNSFTPFQFMDLLSWLSQHFNIYPELVESLPIAGVDGTLEHRMKESSAERWVRAKTGLLNGVVALSGFAGRAGNGVLQFAFMYNGGGDEAHVRSTFDAMAASLVK
jgi:D-alanyl-D-alanine carboxypeptidase/D-alanyl-D-alanine-endopeptidase (penicillin-binding protein 4)